MPSKKHVSDVLLVTKENFTVAKSGSYLTNQVIDVTPPLARI